MATKRKKADDDNGDEAPSSARAAASRQFIRAMTSPEKRRRTTSEHEVRCQSLRQQGLEQVNANMAAWAREMQPILASITSGPPISLALQAHEYMRLSDDLKNLYGRDHGNVLTCGSDDCLQLGVSDLHVESSPRPVKGLVGVTSIACGGLFNLATRQDGSVVSWGANDNGSLGRETENDIAESTPTEVKGFYPSKHCPVADTFPYAKEDKAIVQLAAGENQSLALSISGLVYMMGTYRNEDGSLFRDKRPPDDETQDKARLRVTDAAGVERKVRVDKGIVGRHFNPNQVYQLEDRVRSIACGAVSNAALLADCETIVTWGVGDHGEMARSANLAKKNAKGEYELGKLIPIKPRKPEKPEEPKKPKDDDATPEKLQEYQEKRVKYEKDLVQYEKDRVQYPIDMKAYEEKLVVFESTFLKPHPVIWAGPPMKRTVLSLACGSYHLLVVARRQGEFDSSVYTSGLNNYGQLGHGDTNDRHELTKVVALESKNIVKVDGGLHHSLCLDIRGKAVFAFGRADYGQIGNTDTMPEEGASESLPQPVPFPVEDAPRQFQQIACGDHHSIAMTDRGDVYTWGFGDNGGALGHGRQKDEYRPRKVGVMKNMDGEGIVRMVDGGGQHTAMIVSRL